MDNIGFYCLNFYKSRHPAMHERFAKLGIECEFYCGVTFDDPRIANHITGGAQRVWSYTFGHLDMIQRFVDSGKEFGVFCEDDIYINKNLPRLLPTICKHFVEHDLDVLLLGYLLPFRVTKDNGNYPLIVSDDDHNISFHRFDNDLWGAQMYMYSRKNAIRILAKYTLDYAIQSIHNPSMIFSSDWVLTKDGNRALLSPIMAIEDNSTVYQDAGQRNFHFNCFQNHFDQDTFCDL